MNNVRTSFTHLWSRRRHCICASNYCNSKKARLRNCFKTPKYFFYFNCGKNSYSSRTNIDFLHEESREFVRLKHLRKLYFPESKCEDVATKIQKINRDMCSYFGPSDNDHECRS